MASATKDPKFPWHVSKCWGTNQSPASWLANSPLSAVRTVQKVRIAIVDNGVATFIPRLSQYCCVPAIFEMGDSCPSLRSAYYDAMHGTACAGLVVDIFESLPSGPDSLEIVPVVLPSRYDASALTAAMVWAARNADVVLSPWTTDEWIGNQAAIEKAFANGREGKGTIWVASTGNQGKYSILYPARFSTCIGVGSLTSEDFVASYTNRGSGLDILAPGSGGRCPLLAIDSTDPTLRSRPSMHTDSDTKLREFSGTSGSSALVAGAFGLVLSIAPETTQATLLDWIREQKSQSNHPHDTPRLNISKLLSLASEACPSS